MTTTHVAYIDEAGDEGFGKLAGDDPGGQSRWLILGTCLVTRENDLKLPRMRDEIAARFPKKKRRDLHFRELSHAQKIVVSQEIAKLPVELCLTFSHKVTIPGSRFEDTFKKKGYLYNYLLRWLLERLTSHCARPKAGHSLKIVFSRRANTDYQEMVDYLKLMRDGREKMPPVRSIDWSVLDIENIAVENHSRWAGLQIADCMTSAFFSAVERNMYGNYETSYADLLGEKLIADAKGRVLNCGLTGVPTFFNGKLDAKQEAFVRSFIKK